jgi:hypothetical protein
MKKAKKAKETMGLDQGGLKKDKPSPPTEEQA